jgi:hypothetical protein
VEKGFTELLPTWAILTSITSPATTPAGLLIVRLVLVVVPVVAVPRCAIAADVGVGMAVLSTVTRTNARTKVSGSAGIAFRIL